MAIEDAVDLAAVLGKYADSHCEGNGDGTARLDAALEGYAGSLYIDNAPRLAAMKAAATILTITAINQ